MKIIKVNKMKRILTLAVFSALLISCNSPKNEKEMNKTETTTVSEFSLIGKKAKLTYPELTAEVQYISETQIHWKTTDKSGNVAEETDALTLKPLGNGQFFLNWVENDGTTVSQVIDTQKKTVSAYLTFSDETGKRVSQFLEGSFELL